ncbi:MULTISPECIES: hypothetical protein [pseudomallei group]|uniref:CopG family transcriptional regulator n=1 Tax=Burkholderia thailandensis (strain ATCC 700388 / DSM 13276 / CCUG 48851 / CIP 106301 / E264) TaxID=271848 RepID=Q2T5J4_BURTA|nr:MULTISPECIES: hypothetical protein [pseudomallei group]ABC35670.1 hypothetical protein BTH_II1359 [Burkholderia thailandensis E264]
MSITKRPTLSQGEAAIAAFISGAPDARPAAPPVVTVEPQSPTAPRRPRKKKISMDIDAELLERVDRAAHAMGISRNAVLALGASRFVDETMRD